MRKQILGRLKKTMAILLLVLFAESVTAAAVTIYTADLKNMTFDPRVIQFMMTKQEILNAHNKYRTELNISPLVWDSQLAASAQNWANHLATINKLEHSGAGGSGHGENLAKGNFGGSWTNTVDYWASEKKCFKNGSFPDIYNHNGQCNGISTNCKQYQDWNCTGHYSQIIWKNTTKVGCGRSGDYWVCQYSPAGNYYGQKAY